MNGNAKPHVDRASGKKISDDVTRNSERQTARNHGVDPITRPQTSASGPPELPAPGGRQPVPRIVRCLRAPANRVESRRRECANETQGIADGDDKFAGGEPCDESATTAREVLHQCEVQRGPGAIA